MTFLKPSEIFDVLCYLERDKNHRRHPEAVDTFKKWPPEVKAVVQPFVAGPFPDDAARNSLWRQAQDALNAVNTTKTAAKPAEPETEEPEAENVPGGYPAVLPWPPPPDKDKAEFPDYGIDFRGVPHGLKGKGRKRGELRIDRFWHTRKDGRKQFICRFKLTDKDGVRRDVYPVECFMARTRAEFIHKQGKS